MQTELHNLILVITLEGVVLGFMNMFLPIPMLVKSFLNLLGSATMVIYILEFLGAFTPFLPIPKLL